MIAVVKTLVPLLVFVATFALVQALYVLFVLVRREKPRPTNSEWPMASSEAREP